MNTDSSTEKCESRDRTEAVSPCLQVKPRRWGKTEGLQEEVEKKNLHSIPASKAEEGKLPVKKGGTADQHLTTALGPSITGGL